MSLTFHAGGDCFWAVPSKRGTELAGGFPDCSETGSATALLAIATLVTMLTTFLTSNAIYTLVSPSQAAVPFLLKRWVYSN